MDATLIVARVARAIEAHGLESILIGNAAAALHGAPVTTIDLDFLIRRPAANRTKPAAYDLSKVFGRGRLRCASATAPFAWPPLPI